jgi:hypothetical protein
MYVYYEFNYIWTRHVGGDKRNEGVLLELYVHAFKKITMLIVLL